MQDIRAKEALIFDWISGSTPTRGPALAGYIEETEKGAFGAFKTDSCNRPEQIKECIARSSVIQ